MVKNPPVSAGDMGSIPVLGIWHPTPIFLPGKFHGQRNLADFNPRGCTESDVLSMHALYAE